MRARNLTFLAVLLIVASGASPSEGVIFPLEIFSTNGQYYNDPGVDLYVDVTNGAGSAKFTFYNDSTINCSIARIYFDDGTLLGITSVTNGPGQVTFYEAPDFPGPGDLPNGDLLDPDFVADREFSIGADSPPPEDGVNNSVGEWVQITFQLKDVEPGVPGTLDDVLAELGDGRLRVGLHVVAFDDGSSNTAVNPEPATICLLGLGGLLLRRRRSA